MNIQSKIVMSIVSLTLIATVSCKKEQKPAPPETPRTVQYKLYTEQNFSTDNKLITFQLWMRRRDSGQPLFDSVLAPMKVSEIPDKAHAIIVNKVVPAGNNDVDLQLAFLYTIQDVGMSWWIDSLKVGEPSHIIEYNFK